MGVRKQFVQDTPDVGYVICLYTQIFWTITTDGLELDLLLSFPEEERGETTPIASADETFPTGFGQDSADRSSPPPVNAPMSSSSTASSISTGSSSSSTYSSSNSTVCPQSALNPPVSSAGTVAIQFQIRPRPRPHVLGAGASPGMGLFPKSAARRSFFSWDP